jgi:hypothetical protein
MSCEFSEFQELLNNLEETQKNIDAFIESCAKELAARLLAKVIKRTPVGIYPASTGKKGGTLRRGWTANTGNNAASYVSSLDVKKVGDAYEIEIVNPIEYASYVEFGHRTRGGKGWVEGKFMLTISEDEIQASSQTILENKIKKELGDAFV